MEKQYEKQYDYRTVDKQMQQLWQDDKTYAFDAESPKKLYSIDTPPPTISGALHIGHIFSYTQAEIVARYKRMTGYNVFYPFGFDNNGLPTERLVEKEEGILARNLTREEFNVKCLAKIEKYTAEFTDLWKALGFSCDWNLQYDTISEEVSRLSQSEFIKLIESGDAYIKKAPIIWCTACQTSIAQAELEDKLLGSEFHTIIFSHGEEKVFVATTRPELLPGCAAVLVNPEDDRYKHLIGSYLTTPLYNAKVSVIADENVKIDKGTGVVMCCTFGDSTDIEWVNKYALPIIEVITPDGYIVKEHEYIGGLNVKQARKVIVEQLRAEGLITESKQIEHAVAVHERCSMPCEIVTSSQWYIRTLKYQKELLKYGAKIKWYPVYMKKRYDDWVANLKWDWCVSRQRFFGVPIPVWYCSECGQTAVADISQLPVNPISAKPLQKCPCGCGEFIPETSVLDTWATSSITPKIDELLARKAGFAGKFLPCSMRTHAHDIIRTWSFYTILRSFLHDRDIPWKELMICGFVLAKKGEKLSKSKNNNLYDPNSLLQNYPADMIRYCAANTKLGTDTYFAEKELDDASRTLTKLWNVFKYVAMQLKRYTPKKPKSLMPIDKWIIEKAKNSMHKAKSLLDEYETGLAKQTAAAFFWSDFCDNYVEISKSRIYNQENNFGKEKSDSGKYALYTSFLYILKMFAVFMPHITEFIYQELYRDSEKETSLHKILWDKSYLANQEILETGQATLDIMFEIRKYKSERNLSLRTPIKKLAVIVSKNIYSDILTGLEDIKISSAAEELTLNEGEGTGVEIIN